MSVDTEVQVVEALTAADRCDRCQAQAMVRVVLTTGGLLLFCKHHFDQHEPGLLLAGASVTEDRRTDLVGN